MSLRRQRAGAGIREFLSRVRSYALKGQNKKLVAVHWFFSLLGNGGFLLFVIGISLLIPHSGFLIRHYFRSPHGVTNVW